MTKIFKKYHREEEKIPQENPIKKIVKSSFANYKFPKDSQPVMNNSYAGERPKSPILAVLNTS